MSRRRVIDMLLATARRLEDAQLITDRQEGHELGSDSGAIVANDDAQLDLYVRLKRGERVERPEWVQLYELDADASDEFLVGLAEGFVALMETSVALSSSATKQGNEP